MWCQGVLCTRHVVHARSSACSAHAACTCLDHIHMVLQLLVWFAPAIVSWQPGMRGAMVLGLAEAERLTCTACLLQPVHGTHKLCPGTCYTSDTGHSL
jgi:hypothetical protein